MGAYEFQGTSCTAYTFPYTVTGGASDLISAIQCANANGTADVIDLNNSTMTLTTAFADFGELVGLPGINSAITLQNGTIERNIASSTLFGLLYVSNTGELTVNNVTMRNGGDLNNSSGGAIHVLGRATIENSTFQNNQAVTGGAIQAAFAPVIIRNSLFENNQAAIAGGAIFAAGDNLSIEDSTFSQNSTDGFGGAIFLNNQSSTATTAAAVHTSTFSNNQAERGGAIDVAGASLTVEDSVFENNQATRNTGKTGGAISAIPQTINNQTYTGTLTTLNSVFRGNQATTSGGAIHTEIPTTLTQNLFSGNLAGTDGGALYTRADTTLTNSTLSGNRSNAGSAFYSQSGTLTATNSIIWNNSPITLVVLNSAGSSINYSLVQGWSGGGTGNILTGYTAADIFTAPQDPASAPTTAGDYSLRERSPSIDAASNTAAASNSIGTTDLADNPRYADDPGTGDSGEGSAPLIDMGTYEFQGASPAGLDVNNDGIISPADVIYVINRLGSADLSADVDGDGDVDADDLTAVQNELGNPAP